MVTIPYQMKVIKHLVIIAIILVASISITKAQDYGKLEHWSKTYNLDRTFFVYLNQNMDYFIKVTAPQLKNFDARDYNDIYVKAVDILKKPDFTIIVTEANQLQFRSKDDFMPGQLYEPNRSKKSSQRAVTLLLDVVLPSLQQFVKNYEATHQFQQ
jgi:hypothetical protein